MKQSIIAILFIVLISFSNATHMRLRRPQKISPMEKLQQMSSQSGYAANLFVTINLSLQSGGKVDEVINFVKQAKNEAVQERNDLIKNYKAESARIQGEIEELTTELNTLGGRLDIVLENIDEYQKNIQQLTKKLERLNSEREGIEERQRALEQARDNDQENFRKQQRRDSNAIAALEEIIPALERLRDNGSAFLEKSEKDIMMALQRIPEHKPIQILVELSTKFNAAKLSEVIIKLGQILDSIMQNKEQDEANEQNSAQRYIALRVELQQLWHAKSKEVSEAKTELNQQLQRLRHNQNFQNELTADIEQATNIKDQTISIAEQTKITYETNLAAANEAIEALKTALNILTENEATLEAQEQASQEDQQA